MGDWRLGRKSLSEKYEYYWKQNVDTEGDVTFLVGTQEEIVKGFKTILKVTSPVFEVMLNDRWIKPAGICDDHDPRHHQNQPSIIRLPHLEPGPFRHFLLLLLKDTTTTVVLDDLKLTLNDVLHLFLICKEFLLPDLQTACETFIRKETRVDTVLEIYEFLKDKDEEQLELDCFNFICRKATEICQQEDWLTLSKNSINSILASDSLDIDELDLFHAACSWGKAQVLKNRNVCDTTSSSFYSVDPLIDPTDVRHALGESLFHIRFPLMSVQDFAKFVRPSQILLDCEIVAIYDYLIMGPQEEQEKVKVLDFRCDRRSSNCLLKTLALSSQSENDDDGWLECSEREQYIWFKSSNSVKVHSFGFFGPNSGNSVYEIVTSVKWKSTGKVIGKFWTNIFAKEKCPFWVPFGNPVKIDANTWYHLCFTLKGAPTGCTTIIGTQGQTIHTEEATFDVLCPMKTSQMCGIRFATID